MALAQLVLKTVEDLTRKASDLRLVSDDRLVPVFLKGFDVMSAMLKNDQRQITQALNDLDYERRYHQLSENMSNPSVRSLTFGIFECLHLTLLHASGQRSQAVSSGDISTQTEQVAVVEEPPSIDAVNGAVKSEVLDSPLVLSKPTEKSGDVASSYCKVLKVVEGKKKKSSEKIKEEETQNDKVIPKEELKEEQLDSTKSIANASHVPAFGGDASEVTVKKEEVLNGDGKAVDKSRSEKRIMTSGNHDVSGENPLDNYSTAATFTKNAREMHAEKKPVVKKEEPLDACQPIPDETQVGKHRESTPSARIDEQGQKDDLPVGTPKDSSMNDDDDGEKIVRSSRNASAVKSEGKAVKKTRMSTDKRMAASNEEKDRSSTDSSSQKRSLKRKRAESKSDGCDSRQFTLHKLNEK